MTVAKVDAVEFHSRHEEERLTIIAAVRTDTEIFMGADALVTEDNLERPTNKLMGLSELPLIMGFEGHEAPGLCFGRWLRNYKWPPAGISWEKFAEAAGEALSGINGSHRKRAETAKSKAPDDFAASVLVAGCVGGQLEVWEIGKAGDVSPIRGTIKGIGSGWMEAFKAFHVLTEWGGVEYGPRALAAALDAACKFAPKCGAPFNMVRMTRGGLEVVTGGADGSWTHFEKANSAEFALS